MRENRPKYPASQRQKRNSHIRRRPVRIRFVFLLLISLGLVGFSYFPGRSEKGLPKPPIVSEKPTGPKEAAPSITRPVVSEFKVKKGETFYGILKGLGVSDDSIMTLASKRVDGVNIARLVAGRPYRIIKRDDAAVEYQYEPDENRLVKVSLGSRKPEVSVEPIEYNVKTVLVSGVIENSLFNAIESLGENPILAMDLAEIFAWQIDFFRDLRKGDIFSILLEKFYRDGKFVKYGRILAARFKNAGHLYQAFLYKPAQGSGGYFDEEGGSLRKQFLKAPLKFRRISSGFSHRRLNPVTKKMAPHLGVDYTARTGTPVHTIGDGTVILRKTDRFNGRMLKIRHNSTYSSAYAHLNSFASGISRGVHVRQGQVIGFVGATGRTTGPHLHFAMYRNGRYVDPRKVNVPRASSVPRDEMESYLQIVDERAALLSGGSLELSARNQVPGTR